jgi:beta-N-acetylhexosaminidase
MSDLALARAAGRPWLLGFKGSEPHADFLRLLERRRPRGVFIFRDNLPAGAASVGPLRARLEEAAGQALTVWLDEEGGWIQQLGRDWPSARSLAMAGPGAVEACLGALAAAVRGLGAEVVCAPVADLDGGERNPVIGTRSFGGEPEAAGEAVAAAVRGLRAGGVLCALKHYPGHGDSETDSHLTLPRVDADRTRALIPFRRGIEAGAPALMTAHLQVGDKDPRPATYRPDLMGDLLAGELGFTGLVVTDALEMAGAAALPIEDRAEAALAAGCHLLVLARWQPGAERVLDALEAPIRAGRVPQSWLDTAAERWQAFHAALPAAPPAPALELAPEIAAELQAVREAAVFCPGGGPGAPCWDGESLDVEVGPMGHWQLAEFAAACGERPWRQLAAGETAQASAFLRLGRTPPAAERLADLAARASRGEAPAVLACGPWAWTLPFAQRLATADTTPAGLARLLARARRKGR